MYKPFILAGKMCFGQSGRLQSTVTGRSTRARSTMNCWQLCAGPRLVDISGWCRPGVTLVTGRVSRNRHRETTLAGSH